MNLCNVYLIDKSENKCQLTSYDNLLFLPHDNVSKIIRKHENQIFLSKNSIRMNKAFFLEMLDSLQHGKIYSSIPCNVIWYLKFSLNVIVSCYEMCHAKGWHQIWYFFTKIDVSIYGIFRLMYKNIFYSILLHYQIWFKEAINWIQFSGFYIISLWIWHGNPVSSLSLLTKPMVKFNGIVKSIK